MQLLIASRCQFFSTKNTFFRDAFSWAPLVIEVNAIKGTTELKITLFHERALSSPGEQILYFNSVGKFRESAPFASKWRAIGIERRSINAAVARSWFLVFVLGYKEKRK